MANRGLAKYQVAIFFVLAYAITWPAHLIGYTYATRHGHVPTNEGNVLSVAAWLRGDLDTAYVPFLLLLMFSFGPTVAGIVVTALFKGKDGLVDLWRRTTKVRIGPRWIAVIIGLPIVFGVVSVALGFLTGGMRLQYELLVPLTLFPALLLFMVVCTGLAEEVGWRGYALPELQRDHTAERASWIVGFAWGLWHIPSVLYLPYLRGELNPGLVIPILAGLTFGIVGYTIVLTWIYNNTGSVFWIVILHGWANTVQSYLVLSSGSYLAQLAWAVLPWAVAAHLLKNYDTETLTERRPRTTTSAKPAASS